MKDISMSAYNDDHVKPAGEQWLFVFVRARIKYESYY